MEDDARMQWRGKFEYLFTTFGYTIGLGNIWRFPYTCYRSGGGAFLLPYFLAVLLCTLPMLFLEACLGQFASEGPVKVWAISPLFQGIGYANMFILFITNIYYITIIMYAMYFMLVAFVNIGGMLPWQQCRLQEWGTELCNEKPLLDTTGLSQAAIVQFELGKMDDSCVDGVLAGSNITRAALAGLTTTDFHALLSGCIPEIHSPEEEYWDRFVLEVHGSTGTHDLGPLVGRNVVLLITVWLIVFYCCIRGIRSIAKVIYVTATFPFGLIIILLVRGVTLSGYENGIRYYTQADWSKLADLKIWSGAATQAIYSIGIAFGSHVALASHNRFKNNLVRDCLIISATNTLFSIISGFIVFAFLGHAAERLNKNIEDLVDQGPGILFISYAQGLSQLPGAPVWAFLFYMAVFTLGLDSQFVMVWTMTSSFKDVFPKVFRRFERLGLFGWCLLMMLLGLPLVTRGGMHMIVLMDTYLANFSLTMFVLLESVVVCWLYGVNNFIRDVETMIGTKPRYFWLYWKFTWFVGAPFFSIFVFVASIITYGPSSYNGIMVGGGGEAIGWLIIVTPILIFLVVAVMQIWRYGGIRAATKPTDRWGPATAEHRDGWYARAEDHARQEDNGCEHYYITPISGDNKNDYDHTTSTVNPCSGLTEDGSYPGYNNICEESVN